MCVPVCIVYVYMLKKIKNRNTEKVSITVFILKIVSPNHYIA